MADDRRYRERNKPAEERERLQDEGEGFQEATGEGAAPSSPGRQEAKRPGTKRNLHRFWIGITALAMVAAFILFDQTDSRDTMLRDASTDGIVAGAAAGTVLGRADDMDLTARDYEIRMKEGVASSRLLVWDFAAEDGDVVTVKANGNVVAEHIGIMNKPFSVEVPVPSVIEVVGVKDGVGGITYGIKIPGAVGNSAYFNVAPEGSANKYTLGL